MEMIKIIIIITRTAIQFYGIPYRYTTYSIGSSNTHSWQTARLGGGSHCYLKKLHKNTRHNEWMLQSSFNSEEFNSSDFCVFAVLNWITVERQKREKRESAQALRVQLGDWDTDTEICHLTSAYIHNYDEIHCNCVCVSVQIYIHTNHTVNTTQWMKWKLLHEITFWKCRIFLGLI